MMNPTQYERRARNNAMKDLITKNKRVTVPDGEFEALYSEQIFLSGTRLCKIFNGKKLTLRRVSVQYVADYKKRKHQMDVLLGLAQPNDQDTTPFSAKFGGTLTGRARSHSKPVWHKLPF